MVWHSQECPSCLRTPSPQHLPIYHLPSGVGAAGVAACSDSQVARSERDGGILEGRLLGLGAHLGPKDISPHLQPERGHLLPKIISQMWGELEHICLVAKSAPN